MTEQMDFEAKGHYVFAENIRLTLKQLLKTLEEYRDNVPFDFTIIIKELKEES